MARYGKPLAVVTGASDGIGYELAKQFAENGFDLVVCADGADIAEAGNAFEAIGAAVERVRADLSTSEGVEQLYASVKALGRPIDAVALNAGVGINGSFATETSWEAERRLMALNVTEQVHLAELVLGDMVAQGPGGCW